MIFESEEAQCDTQWQYALKTAVELYLKQAVPADMHHHTQGTPDRVVRAFTENVSGYLVNPSTPLRVLFDYNGEDCDEMVHFRNVRITSTCAHHLVPIIGTVHFAYIPLRRLVGLSKVPRFLRILGKRLQVQETLCSHAVDIFQETVQPRGCAISISAYHCCMISRGVAEQQAVTQTTALRGCFKDNPATRAEFLSALSKDEKILG